MISRTPLALIISDKIELLPTEFSTGLVRKHLSRALFLVSEKVKESSLWKAYIDSLPEKEGITLTFTIEEMDLLEGSEVCSCLQYITVMYICITSLYCKSVTCIKIHACRI